MTRESKLALRNCTNGFRIQKRGKSVDVHVSWLSDEICFFAVLQYSKRVFKFSRLRLMLMSLNSDKIKLLGKCAT